MRQRFLLPGVVVVLGLSGCGGSSSGAAAESSAAWSSGIAAVAAANSSKAAVNSSSTVSSSPPVSGVGKPGVSGKPSVPLVDAQGNPVIPADARAHTDAGAIAFTKYYWSLLDYLDKQPQPEALKSVSQQDCGSCSAVIRHLGEMRKSGERYSENRTLISDATVKHGSDSTYVLVSFRQVQTAAFKLSHGMAPQPLPSVSLDSLAALKWVDGGWRMKEFASTPK